MDSMLGKTIRGYILRERIGTGGFAAVYRAYQPSVERDVAIKIILPEFSNNPQFVRNFETEAQMIARLEHPHIVPLYDYWREPNSVYLIMRWLRGGSLWDSLQTAGAWSAPTIADLLDQVASALATAHQQGVIHQDIKPPNILLDNARNAYLADFGIARDIVHARAVDRKRSMIGTPAYLPPERFQDENPTPQTDIYSLGIVIYELLAGKPPFSAPDISELISQIYTRPLPSLSQFREDLPTEIDTVLSQATAKTPELRQADVMTFAADFRLAIEKAGLAVPVPVGPMSDADPAATPSTPTFFPGPAGSPGPASAPTSGPGTVELNTNTFNTVELNTNTFRPAQRHVEPVNPYKGLRPFDEADASDFFGRETLIQRLLDRLANHENGRMLAVVGPSGSGKSSVVRAGLLPRLRNGALPGSKSWFITKMVPSDDPFREMESALLRVAFDDSTEFSDELRASPENLVDIANRIMPDEDPQLILMIDQFEELFTLVHDETMRVDFLAMLTHAAQSPDSRIFIVITLRADFYDRPLLYEFGRIMSESVETVLPLTASEQQAVITEPARRVGLYLEEGLTAQIMEDVIAQPGALPLLQYALTELFDRRKDNRLTLAIYRQSGGVNGAVARRAEQLYNGLSDSEQVAAQQIFLRLVALNEGGGETRRRAGWSELTGIEAIGKPEAIAIINRYQSYRLLTLDRDPQTREPTVEIAHEALINQWDRMQSWLADNRELLYIQQQVTAAAREWVEADKQPGFLATGARLARFETLLTAPTLALTQDERAYLEAGIAQRQRAVRRRQQVIAALLILTILALGLAGLAIDRQNRADTERERAIEERDRADELAKVSRSRELAVTALTEQDHFDRALLLSVAAYEVKDTLQAYNSLYTSLQFAAYLDSFLHGSPSPVRTLAFSPDGTRLVAGYRDGTLTMWDTTTHQPLELPITFESKRFNSVAFSPAGDLLAAGDSSGLLWVWDMSTGQPVIDPIAIDPIEYDTAIWSIAFSPDGTLLAAGGEDNIIHLWETATWKPLDLSFTGHTKGVRSITFSPAGDLLASGSLDGTIRLWDPATGDPIGDPLLHQTPDGEIDPVYNIAFNRNGRVLVSGSAGTLSGADGVIRQWNVADGTQQGNPITGHIGPVRCVQFSPDGLFIVSSGEDGTVRVWDRASGSPVIANLGHHNDAVWALDFSPNNTSVASGDSAGNVILWDLTRYNRFGKIVPAHNEAVIALATSPDGQWVASGSGDPSGAGVENSVRLWDAQTGEFLDVLGEHAATVTALAFDPYSTIPTLASGSADGVLRLWDVQARTVSQESICFYDNPILSLTSTTSDSLLAVGYSDGTLLLCDPAISEFVAELRAPDTNGVYALAYDQASGHLFSGQWDGTITRWDIAQRTQIGDPLAAHTDMVTSLDISPDGTTLASGSRDFTVQLWDVTTLQPKLLPLIGHTNWVLDVSFSPNGDWLVSSGREGTLILWDTSEGLAIGNPMLIHDDWVTQVAYIPGSNTVVSGSWDTTLGWWTFDKQSWQDTACAIANRPFSADEIQRFFSETDNPTTCQP